MKRKLVFVFTILILMILTSLLFYLKNIAERDVYFYKTAKFCSEITQKMMKTPTSYNELKSSVMYKKSSEDQLSEKVLGKEYLENEFKNRTLSSYQLISFVKYQAKNEYNASKNNTATCYFNAFFIENEGFLHPEFEKMIISNNVYRDADISINDSLSVLKIGDISLFDKLDYLINKNSFRYYEN